MSRRSLQILVAAAAALAACRSGGTLSFVDRTSAGDTGAPGPPATSDTPDTGTVREPLPFTLEARVEAHGDAVALRTNLPATVASCEAVERSGAPCADVDEDGLVDAWEDLVLDRLRPAVRFDESEPLIDDPLAVLVDVGRVTPGPDGNVRVFIMIGYHFDYGRCGLTSHDGDSERVALDLTPLGPGDAAITGAYTAAHEHTVTDHGRVFTGSDLALLEFPTDPVTGEPRWMVYASDGKHATYGTAKLCEDADWVPCLEEDCDADGVDPARYTRLPPVHNAGEPERPLLTDLGAIGFPDEDAWAAQEFCGGQGRGDGCASPVRDKLTDDPFL